LYVDNRLIQFKDKSLINNAKQDFNNEFKMKNLGGAKKILGMEIHRDQKAVKLYLSRRRHLDKNT